MSSETLTDYERRRLENVRRNGEMMASLMLRQKASDLSSFLKPKKKPKPSPQSQNPLVIRRSLRTRGVPPSDYPQSLLPSNLPASPNPNYIPDRPPQLLIHDAFLGGTDKSDSPLLNAISTASFASPPNLVTGTGFDPSSALVLRPENVAKVVTESILSIRFLPFGDRTVVAVGNKLGNLGFWDVDCLERKGKGDGIYVYEPHSAPISGISVHPYNPTKIYTCSYDGYIRLMDTKNDSFNVMCSSDDLFNSICHRPNDINSLYIGEGGGMLKVWDERAGKASSCWDLHVGRINTIDFNPENGNMMATSSMDGMACIWDLRSINRDRRNSLKSVSHQRAVHSAYFSPSGSSVATTSLDDRVGILDGANYDDLSMIRHDNHTARGLSVLSSFRAIWGWDDSYLFIGNTTRSVDIISTGNKTTTALQSRYMTSSVCRFAAHPYKLGSLAGATGSGRVFLWTKV